MQETKASPEQLDLTLFENMGYHHYWHSAQKKGYSSVSIFTKKNPHILKPDGIKDYDNEGRCFGVDYGDVSVSVYMPSGSSVKSGKHIKCNG
ncbi:MAG: hypothetical protein IPP29_03935 [Bacteroidetes bacterium]|nr:hypothetical protein [Bacteroidota bacterium]